MSTYEGNRQNGNLHSLVPLEKDSLICWNMDWHDFSKDGTRRLVKKSLHTCCTAGWRALTAELLNTSITDWTKGNSIHNLGQGAKSM